MEFKTLIDRLNQLYHQSKVRKLTPEELAERDRLRRIYLDGIRQQVQISMEGMERRGSTHDESEHSHQCGENCQCGHDHRH